MLVSRFSGRSNENENCRKRKNNELINETKMENGKVIETEKKLK